ncbi:MAG TPA: hypothetical protein VE864_05115 [Streptosporangiaceae bacterium]|nr:hypothetical protein [Streptosporangiaceae bacterium]
MMGQFVSVAAEILALRAGMSADDPEPQIAARALLGLWHIQADSLRKHLDESLASARIHDLVTAANCQRLGASRRPQIIAATTPR